MALIVTYVGLDLPVWPPIFANLLHEELKLLFHSSGIIFVVVESHLRSYLLALAICICGSAFALFSQPHMLGT